MKREAFKTCFSTINVEARCFYVLPCLGRGTLLIPKLNFDGFKVWFNELHRMSTSLHVVGIGKKGKTPFAQFHLQLKVLQTDGVWKVAVSDFHVYFLATKNLILREPESEQYHTLESWEIAHPRCLQNDLKMGPFKLKMWSLVGNFPACQVISF